jgi:hypothetical protein
MTYDDAETQRSASFRIDVPQLPRFRAHRRPRKCGRVVTYFSWDGRSRGCGEVALGNDLERALALYRECEAGRVHKPSVRIGRRKPCTRRRVDPDVWGESPAWVRALYFNAERRSAEARRAFAIRPADLLMAWRQAGGRCAVSGIDFDLDAVMSRRRAPFAPSLDRIDSSLGYVPGNIRLVCQIVNFAMNEWGEAPLRRLAAAMR